MITVTPDKTRWYLHVGEKFKRLTESLEDGGNRAATRTVARVSPIIEKGRLRPQWKGRPGGQGLTEAIQESIHPNPSGGIGVGVGHRQTLDSLAIYWHAIEVGSTHMVGKKVRFFSDRVSEKVGRQAIMVADDQQGVVVRRPITPHRYVEQLGLIAQVNFDREVDSRVKSAFGR